MTSLDSHPPHQPLYRQGPLTTITTLVSRGGHERFIAEEFERTFGADRTMTPHVATLLIQQESGVSFLISQFRDEDSLRAWRNSARHQQMIDMFEAHSLRELCTIDQPTARVIVPSAMSGPKWKVLITSWIVTFPLLLALIQILTILVPHAPLMARIAITSIVMSMTITWLISPIVMRLTRTWRLRDQQMKIVAVEPTAPILPNA